ncbi:hypothetical protein [Flavobacterium sp.]|uniref:hypothetical protein n=1 Tax=Flavobacterium sp. TaxID=239 RepID=UPI003527D97E
MSYPVEYIPDEDSVYLRIHKNNIDNSIENPNEKILIGAFNIKGDDGLSVNWSKYSNPFQTNKNPQMNGVVSINVKNIRSVSLDAKHDPILTEEIDNRAHSLIIGIPPKNPSKLATRIMLRDMCNWEIEIQQA